MSTAILVLGMHRSGTSALTRVLHLLGADLGSNLMPPSPANPKGYWEHADIVSLHDDALAQLGRTWDDPRPIDAERLRGPDLAPVRRQLRDLLEREFGDTALWAVKDPRLCRLLPLWAPVLEELGVTPRFLLAHRDSREVAASLARREHMDSGFAHLLWLEHVLVAERATRGSVRSSLWYGDLLGDWRDVMGRVASELRIAWPNPLESVATEVDTFLDPSMRHHRSSEDPLPAWNREVTDALLADDGNALDRVAYSFAEAGGLFFPWAERVSAGNRTTVQLLQERTVRAARLRDRVRDLEEHLATAVASREAAGPAIAPASPANASLRDLLEREGTTIVRDHDTPEGDPRVSIVIPLYGRVDLTAKCLESLAANTPEGSFEVILVDNASKDSTPDLLARLDGNVKIVRNEKNLGFATACNQGAALAATPNLLFLNNDTEAHAGWLEPLLETLEDPTVGVVGAKLLFPDGLVQHAGVALATRPSRIPLVAFHLHYGVPADAPEVNVAHEVPVVTGACLLIRRSLFDSIGGFDTFFWNGYEDVDLCLQAGARGARVVYQPASVLTHHESMSGPERFTRVGENERLLSSRWMGKVPVDFATDPDGKLTPTGQGRIRPWSPNRAALQTEGNASRPSASIVILTRNQLPHTQRCLESIERHTPEPHEIVVVDNGSTDGTVKWVADWAASRPHVLLLENLGNRGFGAGCNAGIAAAHGREIVLLNNDTVVTSGWLTGLLDVLDDHPDCGIVGPMTNYASGPQVLAQPGYGDLDELDAFALERAAEFAGQSHAARRLPAFCWLVRRTLIDAIGGFDPVFGLGNFEDDDFCLRAAQAGFSARYALDVFVHHVGSRTFAGEKIDYREAMERNFEIFKAKWEMDPSAELGSYPFESLVTRPRRPRVPIPGVETAYVFHPEGGGWRERVASGESNGTARSTGAAGSRAAGPAAEPAPGTHRLHVGVIGGAPGEAVERLFRRYGHVGELPVFARGGDLAASLARGGETLLVAPDILLTDDALQEMVQVMRAHPEIGALAATGNLGRGAQRVRLPGEPRRAARFAEKRRRRHRGHLTSVDALDPACLLIRADAVAAAGGVRDGAPIEEEVRRLIDALPAAGHSIAVARGAWVYRTEGSGTSGGPAGIDDVASPVAAGDPR
ncbi:MAG: glycosyltransferase [Gemmatimonadetes bacterium]|nr:glycosyltransferase [Gemmatimonadota bacterium]